MVQTKQISVIYAALSHVDFKSIDFFLLHFAKLYNPVNEKKFTPINKVTSDVTP